MGLPGGRGDCTVVGHRAAWRCAAAVLPPLSDARHDVAGEGLQEAGCKTDVYMREQSRGLEVRGLLGDKQLGPGMLVLCSRVRRTLRYRWACPPNSPASACAAQHVLSPWFQGRRLPVEQMEEGMGQVCMRGWASVQAGAH